MSSERKPNSFNSDEHLNVSSVNSLAGFISGHFSEDDRLQLVEVSCKISSSSKLLLSFVVWYYISVLQWITDGIEGLHGQIAAV